MSAIATGRRPVAGRAAIGSWVAVMTAAPLLFLAAAALAQDAKSGGALTAAEPAPLVIYNRTIVVFRATLLGVPPDQRARDARERILRTLAERGDQPPTTEVVPQGVIVKLGGVLAFLVATQDADPLYGQSVLETAQRAAKQLELVAAETRESRDLRAMLTAAGLAALATAIFIALLFALVRARRALSMRLSRLTAAHAERLRIGGVALVERAGALRLVHRAVSVAYWALVLLVAYEWLGYVLGRFPYTRPWGERLTDFLLSAGGDLLEGTARALPELAIAVVIFLIARAVSGALKRFFRRVQSGEIQIAGLDADTARPTRQLVTVIVWLFALVMAYPYLPGSGTDAFKGVSVLIGLMVSIGASSVIGQGASGLILMYTRTLRPGEYVRIGEHAGTVMELGMFATRIRTGLGEELTLPSAFVLGTVTRNYSRTANGEGFVVDATVTIGYDAPWRQVHAMLIEAAHRAKGIVSDPPPQVFQIALSDFYVEYRLVCQATATEPSARAELISGLHTNIQDVFNEYGVQIMSPHYLGDPQEAKVVPKGHWYPTPARKPDSEDR